MLDLYEELVRLVAALEAQRVDYALCGGLAMAVWAFPRATVDIDLLIEPESLNAVEAIAESLGYTFRAKPMSFSAGAIEIRRITKIDPASGDSLMLDLLLVTPATRDVWTTRTRVAWDGGSIGVVSREGLVKLKTFRSSGTDLDDIRRLQEEG
ncbi:MAG TPA: nucleotidyl transferase AbiEii/AbiGii toxin family protein [Thermoanaerobaculia bacterium]